MRLGRLLVVLVVGAALSTVWASGPAWAATNWVVHLASASKGEAHAQALPAAPASPAASCTFAAQLDDDQRHLERGRPRHDVLGVRLDDLGHRHLQPRRERRGDHVVDERHPDQRDELLVQSGGRRREQLEQLQVVGDGGKYDQIVQPFCVQP